MALGLAAILAQAAAEPVESLELADRLHDTAGASRLGERQDEHLLELRWDDPFVLYVVLPTVALALAGRGYQDYLEHPDRWTEIMNCFFFISMGLGVYKALAWLVKKISE